MQKTLIGLGVLGVVLVVLVVMFGLMPSRGTVAPTAADEKNATYLIDGQRVKLVNGVHVSAAAPGSASTITTKYFGNAVEVDLNKDGMADKAFLVTQDMGGSGTFFYLVAALKTADGYVGSDGLFLGDRIAPQQTQLDAQGNIVVTYADRAPGQDFSAAPSVGNSIVVKFDAASEQFGEVVSDFEGEADPDRMTLDMKEWVWVSAQFEDGRVVSPSKADAFKLTFTKDGTFSASTDCNGVGGEYAAKDGLISFEKMMSTLMFCEGSQENEFTQLLTNTTGYHFTGKGELILQLKFDSGTVLFR